MESFTQLHAWQVGLGLVKNIYAATRSFPLEEKFGVTSQLRRASTSILANLAEGFSRVQRDDKRYRYILARSECTEVHAFLLIARELHFLSHEKANTLLQINDDVGRLISGLVYSQEHPSSQVPKCPSSL